MNYFAVVLWCSAGVLSAQSVEGFWVSWDDETGLAKSEVSIVVEDGTLSGSIVRLLLPEDQGKKCIHCEGADKNTPIAGLTIIKGLRLEDGIWQGGTITDPKNGKEYRCKIELADENTLNVRGYLGFSVFGRTQVWKRKQP